MLIKPTSSHGEVTLIWLIKSLTSVTVGEVVGCEVGDENINGTQDKNKKGRR
jgi:hypothetical protein